VIKCNIKKADESDQDFLYEMLYQSIFVENNSPKPERGIIELPEISKYVSNWGKQGDYALIAIDEKGNRAGAVWLRYFNIQNKGYGYISDEIPEIGIAVDESKRNNGIGSILLKELLDHTKNFVRTISLSVQIKNPATRLYKRLGFYEYNREGDSVIMRYDNNE
jgi:ribosomal protein S18 acetylase RimI-like enzyme